MRGRYDLIPLVALLLLSGAAGGADFDYDNDNDIDLVDWAHFRTCLGGPDVVATAECRDTHDNDADDDVDLADFAGFQVAFDGGAIIRAELAGNSLGEYPYFEYVRAFNEDATVEVAIDPNRFPELVGLTCDIYVSHAMTEAGWNANPTLYDSVGGPTRITISGTTIQDNTFLVANAYDLDANAGTGLGVGYDVVLDCNLNGELDAGDCIDGLSDDAGLYAVHDTTAAGPLAVTETIYNGGTWLGQDTYYPTNIASLGRLPLVVISHGNGHDYTWYDHLGFHLASYGCVVMSHQNNTSPGIETASTTTLTNTDYIIGNQATIAGGVLDGHIDSHRIVWIGHSRGAEGITRAYDRIYDGDYTPTNFALDDILLMSSMLPTDFLKTNGSNPHEANYHLWTASGDDDVDGSADCDLCQTFHLHDRATRFRHSTVVQGTGHAWFHDGGGSSVQTGPCAIDEYTTHQIQKGYFLPLIKHYVEGNVAAHDFFWRQYERFRPIGIPTDPCVVVTNTYHNGATAGSFVIDDYQAQTSTTTSSSGGSITYTVQNLTEGRLDDNNSSFSWTTSDPMNGMTHASSEGSDDSRGVVFDWNGSDRYYELEIPAGHRDLSASAYLSFRTCQGTQHSYTVAVLGDLTFSVTLRDGGGNTSTINIGAYGGGVEEPYQRSGGWHNEFETIRVRLTDYLHNNTQLNLADVAAVRFEFGPSYGSNEGRIGMDDIEVTGDGPPNVLVSIGVTGGAPDSVPPNQATILNIEILAMNDTIVPGSPTLYYRYGGGAFSSTPLAHLGGVAYQATLPPGDLRGHARVLSLCRRSRQRRRHGPAAGTGLGILSGGGDCGGLFRRDAGLEPRLDYPGPVGMGTAVWRRRRRARRPRSGPGVHRRLRLWVQPERRLR